MFQELESKRNTNYKVAPNTAEEGNTFFWNVYAAVYDGINHSFPYRKLLWDTLTVLELEPGNRLLDAGCGTGNFERFLAEKKAPPIEVEAVDFSAAMLARAERKCRDLDSVRFSFMDLNQQLVFPDDTFDRIISINTLYALKDPYFTLQEFSRVLKPGGKIVVASPKPQFKVGTIVQDHFKRIKNVWGIPRRLFSITKTFILLPTMGLAPILLNVFVIQKKGAKREYHFFLEDDLAALLKNSSFSEVALGDAYADQNWLAKATRAAPGNQTDVRV